MSSKPKDAETPSEPVSNAQPNRRTHARVNIVLEATFLRANGAETPCLVTNISAGGAVIKSKNPPQNGEKVVIYIDTIGRFEAKVVRITKDGFAVDYRGRRAKSKRTADALLYALNNAFTSKNMRRHPRVKTTARAFVIHKDGEKIPCSILDISLTGASIQIDNPPPLGASIIVGKMRATVIRRHDTGIGVIFTGSADSPAKTNKNAGAPSDTGGSGSEIAASFGRKRGNPRDPERD